MSAGNRMLRWPDAVSTDQHEFIVDNSGCYRSPVRDRKGND